MLQSASATKDLSDAFGLTLTSTLELETAFARAGRNTDQLQGALAALTNAASGAQEGNLDLRESFKTLNLSMADLQKMGAKEAIERIAQTMTTGAVTSEKLNAAYQILGRSAKGLPFGDLAQGLADANGKMGAAASATESLDATMKLLEKSAQAVKKEFMVLIQPIADAFNKFAGEGANAVVIAQAIAAAIAVAFGVTLVKGISSVVDSVRSLAAAFGLVAPATGSAATAAGVYNTVLSATAAVDAAAVAGKARLIAASTQYGVALNAQARAQANLEILQASGVASATALARAQDGLAAAATRVATTTQALTGAMTGATVVTGSLATTTLAATAGLSSFGISLFNIGKLVGSIVAAGAALTLSFAGIKAAIAATAAAFVVFLGPVGAAIALITAIGTALSLAFDLKLLDKIASGFENLTKEYVRPLYDLIVGIGNAMGVATKAINTPLKITENAPSGAGFRTPGMGPQAYSSGKDIVVAGQNTDVLKDTALITGNLKNAADQQRAAEQSLRNQIELFKLNNAQATDRLQLQLKLVGAGELEVATKKSSLEFEQKRAQELLKINGEIARMEAAAKSEKGGAEKYAGQLSILKQQRDMIVQQKDEQTALTAQITLGTQARQMELVYIEASVKARNQVRDIDLAIADFSRSEDDRKLAALNRQIDAEAELAVKKRQEQLGNVPITDEEALAIINKIKDSYSALIAKRKELTAAEKENEAYKFSLDLQNNAMLEGIKITAEMAKLTQTTDQQRITDLRTQLELLAQQEIMKRQAALAPGQKLGQTEQDAIRNKVFNANKGVIEQTQAAIDKSREFSTGWEASYNKFASDATDGASKAAREFAILSDGITDALTKMVQTGKLSFKDLANSLIAEFARNEIKNLLSNIMPKSSGGSLLGGLFGMAKNFLFPGAATGGHISGPTIVGERGPELFTPRSSGYVTPNNQLGMTNQNITQVTYSISAVDAPSFKALVARDPEFLFNVTEQARRNLPSRSRR
jgi:lambda family phage tail tape measure protein